MAIVSARRFVRTRWAVWVAALASLVLCAFDMPFYWKAAPFAVLWATLTRTGALTGWVILAALVALSLVEQRWCGDTQSFSELVADWLEPIQALSRKDLNGYARRSLQSRARRRSLIAQAEAKRSAALAPIADAMSAEAALAATLTASAGFAFQAVEWKYVWKEPWFYQALCWVTFAVVVLFPASIDKVLFNPVAGYQIDVIHEGVLDTLLVLFLFWRYLTSPAAPTVRGVEGTLAFTAEIQIYRTTLWLMALGWLFVNWTLYFPCPNLFSYFQNPGSYWPGWGSSTVRTFLLLTGACIGSITMKSTRPWTGAPAAQRRVALVRNLMMALTTGPCCIARCATGSTGR
jgi:hypothetical protein